MIRRRDQFRLSAQKLGLRKKRAAFAVISVALGMIVVVAVNSLIANIRDLIVRTQFTEQIDPNVVRIYVVDNPYEVVGARKKKPAAPKKRYQFLNEAAFEEMRSWPDVLAADSPVAVEGLSVSALTNRPTNVSQAEGVPEALLRQYVRDPATLAACSNAIPVVLGERNVRLEYRADKKRFEVASTNELAAWVGREVTIRLGDHFAGMNRFSYDGEKKVWVPLGDDEIQQQRENILRTIRGRYDATIYSTTLTLRARVVGLCPGNRVLLPLATAQEFEKWLKQRNDLATGGAANLPEEITYGARGRTTPRSGEFREGIIVVKDRANLDAVAEKVRELGFEATTRGTAFESMVKELDGAVRVVKKIAFGFGALILGLACGLLWSTTSRIVSDSRVDIGLFRALGATKGDIRRLFLSEAVLLGMLGTLVGMLIGWALAFYISRWAISAARLSMSDPEQMLIVPDSVFNIDLPFCLMLLAGAAFVSILAGLLPANRAANIDPVMALKRE
ncbi:MAG: FtsX-like permease family protein [Verrucomicrobiota bacterium]